MEVPEEDEPEPVQQLQPAAQESEPDETRASLRVQATLARIGALLGLKIWIAPGDRKKVAELLKGEDGALLEKLPFNYENVTLSTIEQIDAIWIRGRSIVRAF